MADLVKWCEDNSLSIKVNKTKEMVVDPQKEQGGVVSTPRW